MKDLLCGILFILVLWGAVGVGLLLLVGYRKFQKYLGEKFIQSPREKVTLRTIVGDVFTRQRILALSRWLLLGSSGFLVYKWFFNKARICISSISDDQMIAMSVAGILFCLAFLFSSLLASCFINAPIRYTTSEKATINLAISVFLTSFALFGLLRGFFFVPIAVALSLMGYLIYCLTQLLIEFAKWLIGYLKGDEKNEQS